MTPTFGIEFLVWLLIAAAIVAMLAKRLRTQDSLDGVQLARSWQANFGVKRCRING